MLRLIFTLYLFPISFVLAQMQYPFHTTYYDQKRTQHESLVMGANTIVMLGDSITDMGEWQELTGFTHIRNRGISGDIALGVLDRLDHIVKAKPAKIFLLIGINDIARNIPDSLILATQRDIVRKIKQTSPRTQIFVQSILPTNNEFTQFVNHQNKTRIIRRLNEALYKMTTEERVTFVDLYSSFINSEGKLDKRYTNDGLHLLGEGYLLWVKILKEKGYL